MTQPVQPHLDAVNTWLAERPTVTLSQEELGRSAVVVVDILNGFTREGPLGSPLVGGIIAPSADLLAQAVAAGLPPERVALMADAHPADAEEFRAYPPHCVAGTSEAEWVQEIRELPQFDHFKHFTKNSIASHHTPDFEAWLQTTAPDTLVVIGDVTDLCLYSLGLHLVTRSLHHGLSQRILFPASCAQTWDAPDHPAALYHPLFLYQLARNGGEVVSEVRWG